MNFLFALDQESQEVIVSESPKASRKIIFIERLKKQENPILYNAVLTLVSITEAADFDSTIFKAMDKVCQKIYSSSKEIKS